MSNVPQEDEILIDNFSPYVKKVEVYQDAVSIGSEKYLGEWVWNASQGKLSMNFNDVNDRITGAISPSATSLQFVITFSEPMQSVTCGIPTMNQSALQTTVSADQKQYTFSFNNTSVISNASGLHTLNIEGTDLAGNKLLGLNEGQTPPYTAMPLRNDAGVWLAATPPIVGNKDKCHHFEIACINGNRIAQRNGSVTVSCMDADFDAPTANFINGQIEGKVGDATATITFEDLTAPNAASWFWDFGDGATSTLQNPTHTYTTAGIFTVKLAAYSGSESDVEEKAGYVKISNPGGT